MSSAETPSDGEPAALVVRKGPKLYITLNRPRALNAQNQELREIVTSAVEELDDDPELLVGIITGIGGRAFSAGADLREVEARVHDGGSPLPDGVRSGAPRPVREPKRENWRHFEALRWAAKPVIAAIDGYCLGGGLEMANYCDIRIATETSTFGQPEPRTVGATGGPALHQLSRALPLGEAMLMHLTSQPMGAQRAYELGLIQGLCPDRDSMMLEAESIADQMLECSPEALRVIKRVLRWGADMPAEQVEKLHLLADESRWAANQGSEWRPADRRR